jgi:hypothetical protein
MHSLHRPPPEWLYHYTNQHGLFGILKSAEIWATRIHCLNDHEEYKHGLKLLRETIIAEGRDESTAAQEVVEVALAGASAVNVCVASWSEHADLLSQWRAYSKSAQGYSLGLKAAHLDELARELGWKLRPCIYDGEAKRTEAVSVAYEFWEHYNIHRAQNPEHDDQYRIHLCLGLFVFPTIPFFKHEGFSEEGEWRLVSPPLRRNQLEVRTGASFPITYAKFPLVNGSSKEKIEGRLIVGPGASQELASHGAAVAAERSRIAIGEHRYSLTPLRTGTA